MSRHKFARPAELVPQSSSCSQTFVQALPAHAPLHLLLGVHGSPMRSIPQAAEQPSKHCTSVLMRCSARLSKPLTQFDKQRVSVAQLTMHENASRHMASAPQSMHDASQLDSTQLPHALSLKLTKHSVGPVLAVLPAVLLDGLEPPPIATPASRALLPAIGARRPPSAGESALAGAPLPASAAVLPAPSAKLALIPGSGSGASGIHAGRSQATAVTTTLCLVTMFTVSPCNPFTSDAKREVQLS